MCCSVMIDYLWAQMKPNISSQIIITVLSCSCSQQTQLDMKTAHAPLDQLTKWITTIKIFVSLYTWQLIIAFENIPGSKKESSNLIN